MDGEELRLKLELSVRLSYKLLKDLYEYVNETRSNDPDDVDPTDNEVWCKFLLSAGILTEEQCCDGCKHTCAAAKCKGECKKTVDCIKLPCLQCGTMAGNCVYQELQRAVLTLFKLQQLYHDGNDFLVSCQKFVEGEVIFNDFPFCRTWGKLWERLDGAISTCCSYLLKKSVIDEDEKEDYAMHLRMLLKLPSETVRYVTNFDLEDVRCLPYDVGDRTLFHDDIQELFKNDDVEKVKLLLTNEPYLMGLHDSNGDDLPTMAVKRNSKSIMAYFLEIDATSSWLDSDLSREVARYGRLELFKMFVKRDNEMALSDGFSSRFFSYRALHEACELNHIEIVKFLLDQQSSSLWVLNHKEGKRGFTPLHAACEQYNIEIVALLLKHDRTDVNISNNKGLTPLHLSCQNNGSEVAKLLLQHQEIDVNKLDTSSGQAPLHTACLNNNTEVVELLVQHDDIDVNLEYSNDLDTPLHCVCRMNHLGIATLLLQQSRIDINAKNKNGNTALHLACSRNNTAIVSILMQHQEMERNAKNDDWKTADQLTNSFDIKRMMSCIM